MRIYVSGAISGREKEEYQNEFSRAAEMLRVGGHDVVNPAIHDLDLEYWDFIRLNYLLIDMCDAIYMLDSWQNSTGANIERAYALHKGKKILGENHEQF